MTPGGIDSGTRSVDAAPDCRFLVASAFRKQSFEEVDHCKVKAHCRLSIGEMLIPATPVPPRKDLTETVGLLLEEWLGAFRRGGGEALQIAEIACMNVWLSESLSGKC